MSTGSGRPPLDEEEFRRWRAEARLEKQAMEDARGILAFVDAAWEGLRG